MHSAHSLNTSTVASEASSAMASEMSYLQKFPPHVVVETGSPSTGLPLFMFNRLTTGYDEHDMYMVAAPDELTARKIILTRGFFKKETVEQIFINYINKNDLLAKIDPVEISHREYYLDFVVVPAIRVAENSNFHIAGVIASSFKAG